MDQRLGHMMCQAEHQSGNNLRPGIYKVLIDLFPGVLAFSLPFHKDELIYYSYK